MRNVRPRVRKLQAADLLENRVVLDGQTIFDTGTALSGTGLNFDVDLADLDRDGDLDAFITSDTGEGNQVWFNDGQGRFIDSGQRLGTASNIYSALGDLDADGDIDAVVATRGGGRIWLNNGAGQFTASTQVLGNALSIDVALGDLDRDGDLDAFLANTNAAPDRVYLNNGAGVFTDSGQLLGAIHSKSVVLGDLDKDGDLDAIVGNGPTNGLGPDYIWLNDGNGRFTDSGQRMGNAQTQHIALGDLDGDGDLDSFSVGGSPASVWKNDGTGRMVNTNQSLGSSGVGSHAALADLDNDGDLDAYIANWSQIPDTVWINDGSGNFTDSLLRLGNTTSSHVALADVNRDGNIDALVANYGEAERVYLNRREPRDINAETNVVFEQMPAGTPVGITAQANLNGVGPITYSLTSDAGGLFAIDASSGVVTVKDGTRLNVTGSTPLQITITATAPNGATNSNRHAISVLAHPLARANVVASDGQFTDRVQLEWNAVPTATFYEVWRGTTDSWAQASFVLSTSNTTASDLTADPGTNYRYWVRPATQTMTGVFGASDLGSRAAIRPTVSLATGLTLVYDASTGDLVLQSDVDLRFLRLQSTSGLFGGAEPTRYTTGELNGQKTKFIRRLPAGLTQEFLMNDLLASGALPNNRAMDSIDLVYLTNPLANAVVVYKQATGEMAIDGKVQLTTLEIRSKSGIFTGTKPDFLEGLFDVFRSDKFFYLKPSGFGDLTLGRAAQAGLSAASLIADLSIEGAQLPVGGISSSIAHIGPMRIRPNAAPTPQNDSGFSTQANQQAAINVSQLLANDTDPDGDAIQFAQQDTTSNLGAAVSRDLLGSIVYNPTGSQTLKALAFGQSRTDEFRYVINDDRGGVGSALVRIQVVGVNDSPTAEDDATTVRENQAAVNLTSLVLANDRDVDAGDTFSISSINTVGTRGGVTLLNGQLTYQAGSAFDYLRVDDTATDRFQYMIRDSRGATSTKTVTVTVIGESDREGDLDGDSLLNLTDIQLMCSAILQPGSPARFDLDKNGQINSSDMDYLVRTLIGTTYGDANLDGVFNTTDLVFVFQAGHYDDGVEDNSTWATGDWNCDREFDSSDLVVAFQVGGFQG